MSVCPQENPIQPWIGGGYLPWMAGYLSWMDGTYLVPGIPILNGGTCLGWRGVTYLDRGCLPWMGYLPWTQEYPEIEYPLSGQVGVPPSRNGGTPSPSHRAEWGTHPGRQRSRGSTCYTADGMPLAFTQEDFLVPWKFDKLVCLNACEDTPEKQQFLHDGG